MKIICTIPDAAQGKLYWLLNAAMLLQAISRAIHPGHFQCGTETGNCLCLREKTFKPDSQPYQ